MQKKVFVVFAILLSFSFCLFGGCSFHEHEFTEWQVYKQATCQTPEILIRKCKKCDYTETKQGEDKTDHKYNTTIISPTINSLGYTLYSCSCGHSYKDNFTCLVEFSTVKELNINIDMQKIPKTKKEVVNKDSKFNFDFNNEFYQVESFKKLVNGEYQNINNDEIISKSLKVFVVWKKQDESKKDFYKTLDKINQLEELSIQFNKDNNLTANPKIRVSQYIRQNRYNGFAWSLVGGSAEPEFVNLVETQNKHLKSLQEINILAYEQGQEIDFVHMFAVINVCLHNNSLSKNECDLSGWGGDLCQLALSLKQMTLQEKDLLNTAKKLLGTNTASSFDINDMNADIDGVNIVSLLNTNKNNSLECAVNNYYKNLKTQNKKQTFVQNVFKIESALTKEKVYFRIINNPFLKMWSQQNGLNLETDTKIIEAVSQAFIEYFN